MATTLNKIVVHLSENVDEATLDTLERAIRLDRGVVSVEHQPSRNHLMVVMYDSTQAKAANILHSIQKRGLHAQLVGM